MFSWLRISLLARFCTKAPIVIAFIKFHLHHCLLSCLLKLITLVLRVRMLGWVTLRFQLFLKLSVSLVYRPLQIMCHYTIDVWLGKLTSYLSCIQNFIDSSFGNNLFRFIWPCAYCFYFGTHLLCCFP